MNPKSLDVCSQNYHGTNTRFVRKSLASRDTVDLNSVPNINPDNKKTFRLIYSEIAITKLSKESFSITALTALAIILKCGNQKTGQTVSVPMKPVKLGAIKSVCQF